MSEKAQVIPLNFDDDTKKLKWQRFSPRVLKAAYGYCAAITRDHYENFPVASAIIPKKMRSAIQALYAFSRIADDFADENEFRNERLERLNEWEAWLNNSSSPTHPVFIALHDTIRTHKLPIKYLQDLLTAFKMDVTKNRYDTFSDVLFYCQHSANPVGRLVLHLFGQSSLELFRLSDYICTALQLTNFWQDIAIDLKKNRVYLPQEELDKFDLPERALFNHTINVNFKRLMQLQYDRTKDLFINGKPLGLMLSGKLGVEIRLTWLTGATILKRTHTANFDVFHNRPQLTRFDFLRLFFVALSRKRYASFKI